ADEPTGNLDEETEKDIIGIFKRLAHEHQKCVIVVTHSKEIAEQSDSVLYLRKGVLQAYE
ncbi:MAG: ABC transporter ATP-binding protein, partial [Lachnospiraceae bacterium]|nr:ABC transporter ATP-binding protein [Lachnospiraceae bacterium]